MKLQTIINFAALRTHKNKLWLAIFNLCVKYRKWNYKRWLTK